MEGKGFKEIATELNADQIKTPLGNPWAGQAIEKMLTNEGYSATSFSIEDPTS